MLLDSLVKGDVSDQVNPFFLDPFTGPVVEVFDFVTVAPVAYSGSVWVLDGPAESTSKVTSEHSSY